MWPAGVAPPQIRRRPATPLHPAIARSCVLAGCLDDLQRDSKKRGLDPAAYPPSTTDGDSGVQLVDYETPQQQPPREAELYRKARAWCTATKSPQASGSARDSTRAPVGSTPLNRRSTFGGRLDGVAARRRHTGVASAGPGRTTQRRCLARVISRSRVVDDGPEQKAIEEAIRRGEDPDTVVRHAASRAPWPDPARTRRSTQKRRLAIHPAN